MIFQYLTKKANAAAQQRVRDFREELCFGISLALGTVRLLIFRGISLALGTVRLLKFHGISLALGAPNSEISRDLLSARDGKFRNFAGFPRIRNAEFRNFAGEYDWFFTPTVQLAVHAAMQPKGAARS